ncbi:MAG: hypothetical protein K6T90_22115 [Leptolyngbyaceae cyanobacterium HOT.MB2.61]|nr:hypothetical protein [Leptolyngbyaceae cyanobacterium HOT.MB2.61]
MKFTPFFALILIPFPGGQPASAQAPPPPLRLTPAQIQRTSSGLYRFSSQDFFNRGQRRLEEEIQILTQRRQFLTEGILKIDQKTLKRIYASRERQEEPSDTLEDRTFHFHPTINLGGWYKDTRN